MFAGCMMMHQRTISSSFKHGRMGEMTKDFADESVAEVSWVALTCAVPPRASLKQLKGVS